LGRAGEIGARLKSSRSALRRHGFVRDMLDVGFPGVDRLGFFDVDIQTKHTTARAGELKRERQAHVAESNDSEGIHETGRATPRTSGFKTALARAALDKRPKCLRTSPRAYKPPGWAAARAARAIRDRPSSANPPGPPS